MRCGFEDGTFHDTTSYIFWMCCRPNLFNAIEMYSGSKRSGKVYVGLRRTGRFGFVCRGRLGDLAISPYSLRWVLGNAPFVLAFGPKWAALNPDCGFMDKPRSLFKLRSLRLKRSGYFTLMLYAPEVGAPATLLTACTGKVTVWLAPDGGKT